jgi:hypothetical protein
MYEGRVDDALAAVKDHPGAVDQWVLARVLLRKGDRAGALVAAHASLTEDTMPLAYLAASAAVEAGELDDTRARAWRDMPEVDRRMYGELLAGDIARATEHWDDALAAYKRASLIGDGWLVHERLSRALLGAKRFSDAERELDWCIAHRGEAVLVANPSLSFLPDVYTARHTPRP